ncbi:AtpZ/AtpI family protein [Loktanella sp. IMCC34160]|uniref:AtpZ/AtpI family protein n=1 Tax=Loktanella sp. IMCC34160 TaxID=2510646 RepID=UPI00101DD2AC|nr:AtpZ/AtpI family protein [Loktanella sp. IMCC34160]RYG92819.1 AtpZ/AtpI family protein [Loktanella sp. IMCC34160]
MRGKSALSDRRDLSEADRLKALENRIAQMKGGAAEEHHMKKDYSQANLAWRMVVELVAGLGIGFGIGYGLDALFGTTPFLMVLFILLGLAAGIQTMLRTAKEIEGLKLAETAGDDRKDERNGD